MAQRAISPLSGEPLYVSLTNGFMTRTGIIRFALSGRDGEEDEDGDDEDGDDAEDGEDEEQGSGGKKKEGDTDAETEIANLRKRMKAADRNASALQAKIKEFEDKDKDESTKTAERVKELETESSELKGTVSALRLENAFLLSNSQSWDDPEYALDFAQRKGYLEDVVEEDGSVDKDALKAALAKLAKDKPSMLKKSTSGEDEEEESGPPATDQGVGSKRKKGKAEADEAALRQRFPNAFRY